MLHHFENHLENMRQKPDHTKRQYALVVSLSITLIIFGFWITAKRSGSNEYVAKKPLQPVKALTANAGDAFDYVRDLIFGANKTKYESDNVEVVPGKI
jgi:hypothetical protein